MATNGITSTLIGMFRETSFTQSTTQRSITTIGLPNDRDDAVPVIAGIIARASSLAQADGARVLVFAPDCSQAQEYGKAIIEASEEDIKVGYLSEMVMKYPDEEIDTLLGTWLTTGRGDYDLVICGRSEDCFITEASVDEFCDAVFLFHIGAFTHDEPATHLLTLGMDDPCDDDLLYILRPRYEGSRMGDRYAEEYKQLP